MGQPVNNPPVANDDTITTDEDTPVTIPVLDNDTDANYNGTDSFTYTVKDNQLNDMNLLLAARNKPAQATSNSFFLNLSDAIGATILDSQGTGLLLGKDPRDLDGDGIITVLDARKLAILMRS
jgi:hypothetical protein